VRDLRRCASLEVPFSKGTTSELKTTLERSLPSVIVKAVRPNMVLVKVERLTEALSEEAISSVAAETNEVIMKCVMDLIHHTADV
jgi:hypothetical protein